MASWEGCVKLVGNSIQPATVDGPEDVFTAPRFTLTKSRWVADAEADTCVLCEHKFSQIRRKHHCRQCGRVLCSKCCSEKVSLPQLGIDEPGRICEGCRPITELVTKSRSTNTQHQMEAALGLAIKCKDPEAVGKVVELGGLHSLIALARSKHDSTLEYVASGLHTLSTHQPLHDILARSGAVKAVCSVLKSAKPKQITLVIDGISTLMIFCKSPHLKTQAIEDGGLEQILELCDSHNDAVALLAVSTLCLIAEHDTNHAAIVDSDTALSRILHLVISPDTQMQEVSLKTLCHLSHSTDWNRHRIVQEDADQGENLREVLYAKCENENVLINAMCLVGNLATSSRDQGALKVVLKAVIALLTSESLSQPLLLNITRTIANFARFRENTMDILPCIEDIVNKSLVSKHERIHTHACRIVIYLLHHYPTSTIPTLLRKGAEHILESIARSPDMVAAMQAVLIRKSSDIDTPQ